MNLKNMHDAICPVLSARYGSNFLHQIHEEFNQNMQMIFNLLNNAHQSGSASHALFETMLQHITTCYIRVLRETNVEPASNYGTSAVFAASAFRIALDAICWLHISPNFGYTPEEVWKALRENQKIDFFSRKTKNGKTEKLNYKIVMDSLNLGQDFYTLYYKYIGCPGIHCSPFHIGALLAGSESDGEGNLMMRIDSSKNDPNASYLRPLLLLGLLEISQLLKKEANRIYASTLTALLPPASVAEAIDQKISILENEMLGDIHPDKRIYLNQMLEGLKNQRSGTRHG